jgi:hypothetical protein
VCRVVKAMVGQQLRVVWSRAGRIESVLVVMVNGFGRGLEQWTGDVVLPGGNGEVGS